MVSNDRMSAMMDRRSFNGRSTTTTTTTTTMTGVRQSQIESAVRWIKSSQMDQVESDGSSQVTHCMHALVQRQKFRQHPPSKESA
jgi:hypothetical protein